MRASPWSMSASATTGADAGVFRKRVRLRASRLTQLQPLPLTRKITGKVKVSPSSAINRRWHRHRIGAPHHRQRGLVEGRIARAFFDIGREHVAHAVEREANLDLADFCWRSFGYRLCLSRCATSSFCQVARARRALSPVPITGATERCPSGMASELGVAVASAATDSVEAEVCTAAIFGSSSFGFFDSFSVTTRSASSARSACPAAVRFP